MVDASSIQSEIDNNKVMVFSKSYCPYCVNAKQLLQSKGIAFKAIELDQVSNGADIQNTLQKMSGQRTVPNIYINRQHVGGCSDLVAANDNGKLKQMCDAAGIANSC